MGYVGLRMPLREFPGLTGGDRQRRLGGAKGNAEAGLRRDKRRANRPGWPRGGPSPTAQATLYSSSTARRISWASGRRARVSLLLTAHIAHGHAGADRRTRALFEYSARELPPAPWREQGNNLIVLGDFNIDDRGDNPLFQAFVSTGLVVPAQLLNLKTTYSTKPKYYDQIAWFMGDLDLLTSEKAGVIDFAGAVYQELPLGQMAYRMSDHFPLWVEFLVDRSTERMARVLGVDVAMPDPFAGVPD